MITTCVVCNITNSGMIHLFGHPNNLDFMLSFVSAHQVEQDDYLCINCYDELKIAFNFKQKSQQSKLYRQHVVTGGSVELELKEADEFSELQPPFEFPTSSDKRVVSNEIPPDIETNITTTISNENDRDDVEKYLIEKYNEESYLTNEIENNHQTKPILPEDDEQLIVEVIESETDDITESGTEETIIKCDVCEKEFTRKGNFKRHMSQLHSVGHKTERMPRDKNRRGPVPKYREDDIFKNLADTQCEFCFVSLNTKDDLRNHETRHREEQRPYRCNQTDCPARFKDRYSVRSHIRIHSDMKPYKCRFCEQRFHQRGNVKAHERCHTGEKPFLCPHCGKGFAEKGNLKSHIRFHTGERPHTCTHCPKKFTTHYSHKIHIRSHTQEKPFACNSCGKSFNCSGKLRIHSRIHSGHRPYKCELCDACFMDSSRLKRHSKTH